MQHTVDDMAKLLDTLRRSTLGEISAIEQINKANYPGDLAKFLDASRRSKLQIVAQIDRMLYGKRKERRKKSKN